MRADLHEGVEVATGHGCAEGVEIVGLEGLDLPRAGGDHFGRQLRLLFADARAERRARPQQVALHRSAGDKPISVERKQ